MHCYADREKERILSEGVAGKSFREEDLKEWTETLEVEKEKTVYHENTVYLKKHDAFQLWMFWKVNYLVGTGN